MLTINGIDELRTYEGKELGVSAWKTIDQAAIDAFADATGDHQFIHVDPEKAKATPFGGTIAHGLFTISLGPVFSEEIWTMTGIAFALNYGYEKVRFPAPVPVDSKLRMTATLAALTDVAGGVQARVTQTYEIEGGSKPVCVAESVVRFYAAA
ncbi:MaoC family dehydratase [Paraconexibacter antarcticus]|uniref:MaoC family dehydratase n=1 Tax=Paraconexibacter antarcticus TaxID=2949664 RepID=A0ABY5DS21_9ACTN|nr:MaoC family dehydratase [Paraconexibacter antarcticus]UTI64481.1 MaoC family dehydratase [Paraconexibacter antarcticus]